MNELDERRVIEALRALPAAITVTDQDLGQAHTRLHEQLPADPSRRPAVVTAIVAAAALVAVIYGVTQVTQRDDAAPVGPADRSQQTTSSAAATLAATLDEDAYEGSRREFLAGRTPVPADVPGLWLLRRPYGGTMVFDADGVWSFESLSMPYLQGDYRLEGDLLTRVVPAEFECVREQELVLPWTASLAEDGSLRLQFDGADNVCTPANDREVWDRVVPGPSPIADYLRESVRDLAWERPRTVALEHGVYVAPATGHLMDLSESGSYSYYDDPEKLVAGDRRPADTGRLTTIENGVTTTVQGTCRGGGFAASALEGTIAEVAGIIPELEAVQLTSTEGDCASGIAADAVWVQLFSY